MSCLLNDSCLYEEIDATPQIFDWQKLPEGIKHDEHWFACSDIHGRAASLEKLLEMRNTHAPDSCFIHLGDIGDRGPNSLECYKLISEIRDPVLILGNHDILLQESLQSYEEGLSAWLSMDGPQKFFAIDDWKAFIDRSHTLGYIPWKEVCPEYVYNLLGKMILFQKDGNLLFTHAGYYPKAPISEQVKIFKDAGLVLKYKKIVHPHFALPFFHPDKKAYMPKRNWLNPFEKKERVLLIHGHTPMPGPPMLKEYGICMDICDTKLWAMEIYKGKYRFYS